MIIKYYRPKGRKNHGSPLKRLLDMQDWEELISGSIPLQLYDDDDDDDDDDDGREGEEITQYYSLIFFHIIQN